MTGSVNLANWTQIAKHSVVWKNDEDCPFSYHPCWEICGQFFPDDAYAYMYRQAPTTGYHQIQLTYSIAPIFPFDHIGDYASDLYDIDINRYCEIHFSLDGELDQNDWKLINKSVSADHIQNAIYTFDSDADNNAEVTIFIFANTGNDDQCCRIRDFKLTGIPILTPSKLLTKTPSDDSSNVPTPSPTFDRSQSPNIKPTDEPTIVRSKNPTPTMESPSNSPSGLVMYMYLFECTCNTEMFKFVLFHI